MKLFLRSILYVLKLFLLLVIETWVQFHPDRILMSFLLDAPRSFCIATTTVFLLQLSKLTLLEIYFHSIIHLVA
jgi:hypothetical protein